MEAKRAVVKRVLEGSGSLFAVAAAETGHQDVWQRSQCGFVGVSGEIARATGVLRLGETVDHVQPGGGGDRGGRIAGMDVH
jgi:uncharacterized protein YlxP (DUF503 family)